MFRSVSAWASIYLSDLLADITDLEDWFHCTEVNAFMVLFIYLKLRSFVSDSTCSLHLINYR